MKKKWMKITGLALSAVMALGFSACDFEKVLDSALNGDWEGVMDEIFSEPEASLDPIYTENLSIHFLELGNAYTGDCTLIKTGNVEVLIDAGSREGSAATIVPYVQQYCTDGVLDYVIATHGHQDHIAGFVGTKSAPGVLESFSIGTIIDFSLTNATSNIYDEYCDARDEAVSRGAKHYTASECVKGQNGAQKVYTLDDGITMEILDQKYYYEETSNENDYSVCVMVTQGINNYLFTGDLDKSGETSLAEKNELPKCKLYKAGHHGSGTSSNDVLLQEIQPEIVCVCCCAGSSEYTSNNANQFPTQEFIDRIAIYTDQIFVTTLCLDYSNKEFTSMNGNIVAMSDGGDVTITCSNNNTILKETEWFSKNRTWPSGGV